MTSNGNYPTTNQVDPRRGSNVSRQTALLPFGMRYEAVMPYGFDVPITTTSSTATASTYVFRLNSLFDPDLTGTGHQPYQYDQVSGLYGSYRVTEVEFELRFYTPTTGGLWVGYVMQSQAGGSVAGLSVDSILERQTGKCLPLPLYGDQSVLLRQRIRIPTLLGLTDAEYSSSIYQALVSASPAFQAYLQLFVVDPAGTSAQTCRVSGRINYKAEFFNYIAPGSS
jgi:hypothetical protein